MSKDTERLKRRMEDQQAMREEERRRHKSSLNEEMAKDRADYIENYDFYCDRCNCDFSGPAHKEVNRLYGDPIVSYWGVHEDCGMEAFRLLSHRDYDDYYEKSEKVLLQRNQYAQDMLTPDNYGFNTLYS